MLLCQVEKTNKEKNLYPLHDTIAESTVHFEHVQIFFNWRPLFDFDEAKILPNFWFWHFCLDNCNILFAFDAPLCAFQEAW